MNIETTRFGEIEVDERKLITFPQGLLGFGAYTRYVLIQPNEDSFFLWLQSVDTSELAFVVADPSRFAPTYRVPFKPDEMEELGILKPEDAEVYVIVNKHGSMLTGNLQGPLVIGLHSRIGRQLVLSDRRFTTRVPLVELPKQVEAIPA